MEPPIYSMTTINHKFGLHFSHAYFHMLIIFVCIKRQNGVSVFKISNLYKWYHIKHIILLRQFCFSPKSYYKVSTLSDYTGSLPPSWSKPQSHFNWIIVSLNWSSSAFPLIATYLFKTNFFIFLTF